MCSVRMAWSAQPSSRAWAASLVKRVLAKTLAGSMPVVPKVRAAAVSALGPDPTMWMGSDTWAFMG